MLGRIIKAIPPVTENILMFLGILVTLVGVPVVLVLSFYYTLNALYFQSMLCLVTALVLVYINKQYSKG